MICLKASISRMNQVASYSPKAHCRKIRSTLSIRFLVSLNHIESILKLEMYSSSFVSFCKFTATIKTQFVWSCPLWTEVRNCEKSLKSYYFAVEQQTQTKHKVYDQWFGFLLFFPNGICWRIRYVFCRLSILTLLSFFLIDCFSPVPFAAIANEEGKVEKIQLYCVEGFSITWVKNPALVPTELVEYHSWDADEARYGTILRIGCKNTIWLYSELTFRF